MQIATDRLVLRDYVEDDWLRVYEYRCDERYLRYYQEDSNKQRAREFIRMVTGWATEQPRRKFQLAITRAEDGFLIGSCGVRGAAGDPAAEFGCELDPRHWGKGLGWEASCAIINYGFRVLGVHHVWARTISENLAATKLAEHMGMKREGSLRESRFFRGRWWDEVIFAVLEHEWPSKNPA